MRLLLLFLLGYFVFRYGKYLFSQFQPVKPQAKPYNNPNPQPKQTHYHNTTNASKKQQPEEGEYVDFEEVK